MRTPPRSLGFVAGCGIVVVLLLTPDLSAGDKPVAKVGGKVYVTSWFGDWISVIDIDAGKVTGEVKVGVKNHNVFLSPDQKHAWVTNHNEGTVAIIDTATDKIVTTIRTGKGPRHTFIASDEKHAYVTNELDDTVSVIDPKEYRILTQIRVG